MLKGTSSRGEIKTESVTISEKSRSNLMIKIVSRVRGTKKRLLTDIWIKNKLKMENPMKSSSRTLGSDATRGIPGSTTEEKIVNRNRTVLGNIFHMNTINSSAALPIISKRNMGVSSVIKEITPI